MKFKVGDRVREDYSNLRMVGTIRELKDNEWLVDWDLGYNVDITYPESRLELVQDSIQPIKKPTFMSSIVRKIKDLTLSSDDRILRKHSFEDESGEMTSQAEDMMDYEILAERWAKRRVEIAEQLRKVEAEEKAA